jgi:hypothetical protein
MLLKAADFLEEDKVSLALNRGVTYGYACVAIMAVSYAKDNNNGLNEEALEEAMGMFRKLYKPEDKYDGDSWFAHYMEPGAIDIRIAALRHTAAQFN